MTSRRIAAALAGALLFTILPGVAASASRGDPGERLWASRYAGPAGDVDSPADVGVSPDGSRVFVAGQSHQGATNVDIAAAAYHSATGEELWFASHSGSGGGWDSAQAMGVSPNGSMVFVTGYSDEGSTEDDFVTVAYDAVTGQEAWFAEYDAWGLWEAALDLTLSPDGSMVFVTGYSEGDSTDVDYATVAYDAVTGDELWVARYNGPGNGYDYPYAMGVAPDGSTVLVTGDTDGGASEDDYTTVAYRAGTGHQLWVARYNGPGNESDHAAALGVGPDGDSVFVTGSSTGAGPQEDYLTIAYDVDTGTEKWTARFAGPWSDQGIDVGVSPDGARVFVTGNRRFGRDRLDDFVTVAYDAASGHLMWRNRNGGPHQEWPAALAVNPDGLSVVVTGALFDADGTTDWGTIALSS